MRPKPYRLPPPSQEQQAIVDVVRQKSANLKIHACAGSGKTTTVLHIAMDNPGLSILLLTYNAKLRLETKERLHSLLLTNLEVHTFHSFAVRYGSEEACRDHGMIQYLRRPDALKDAPAYDIVITDEMQDMNPLYFRLVVFCLYRSSRRSGRLPRLIALGDPCQSVYGFNRADPRFLSMAQRIFPSDLPWRSMHLQTTYRLTHPMARFVEACAPGIPPIHAVRDGLPVKYRIVDSFDRMILEELRSWIDGGCYRPDELFVLAPSLRTARSPVRGLANGLTRLGVPIYVPTSDEERLDADVIRNKIVFSTFHQVKGLERRIVVVYNFDASYLRYYDRPAPDDPPMKDLLPNALYVAITRATDLLMVIHDAREEFLPCVDAAQIPQVTDFRAIHPHCPRRFEAHRQDSSMKDLAVTDLVRHVPIDVLAECFPRLSARTIRLAGMAGDTDRLRIPIKVRQGLSDVYENVSEITGTCIPCLFEWNLTHRITMIDHLKGETMKKLLQKSPPSVRLLDRALLNPQTVYDRLHNRSEECASMLLRCATRWCAEKSGYQFKTVQIRSFDWLTMDNLDRATERLQKIFPEHRRVHLRFEYPLTVSRPADQLRLIGFADIVDVDAGLVCELKAVQTIDPEHLLQLALYLYLARTSSELPPIRRAILVNIIDGSIREIRPTDKDLETIVDTLIAYRKEGASQMKDESFLNLCRDICREVHGDFVI